MQPSCIFREVLLSVSYGFDGVCVRADDDLSVV